MEAYVIATIKNNSGVVKGYRILDIETNTCKDVTKDQLISILKLSKDFKLENVKLSGGKLQGIYASIEKLPIIGCDNAMRLCISDQLKSRCIVLKIVLNEATGKLHGVLVTNALGKTKMYRESHINELIKNKVAYIDKNEKGIINIYAKREKVKIENKPKVAVCQNTSYKVTDEEALDMNDIWDFFKFRQYMMERNYKFDLYSHREEKLDYVVARDIDLKQELLDFQNEARYFIRNIDKRCKIVHLPSGILEIDNLFEDEGNICIDKDTIIIPSTVISINRKFLKYTGDTALRTRRLLFQTDNNNDSFRPTIDLSGLFAVEVLEEWNLPMRTSSNNSDTNLTIENIYNNSKLNGKYIISGNRKCDIKDSFKDSEINSDISFKNIKNIDRSFINTTVNSTIIIGNDIEKIADSFKNVESNNIQFPKNIVFESDSIERITNSFTVYRSNGSIIDLDLNKLPKIVGITYSFHNTGSKLNLYNVEKATRLSTILGSFNNSNVERIKLNKKTESFSYIEGVKYEFEDDYSKSLCNYMYYTHDTEADELKIDARFLRIDREGLRSSRINKINPDNNIKHLGSRAFIWSKLKHFDSSWFKEVSIIPDECFVYSDLESVIFGENIRRLSDDCLASCDKLNKMLVHPNVVNISKNTFKRQRGNGEIITLYCVKGSVVEKEFKTKKYINICTFDTYEEAYKEFIGLQSSEKQVQKFKFVASLGNIDETLTKEPYVRYAPEVVKMQGIAEDTFSEYVDYTPLKSFNTNGPSIYDFKLFSKLVTIFNNITSIKSRDDCKFTSESMDETKVPKRFKYIALLLNMIASNRMDNIFCEENTRMLDSTANLLDVHIIFIDSKCGAFRLKLRLIDDYLDYYTLVKNGKIVWMSPLESESNKLMSLVGFNSLFIDKRDYTEDTKINGLSSYLRVGDYCKKNNQYNSDIKVKIGGMELPPTMNYYNLVFDIIKHNTIIIGSGYNEGVTGKYSRRQDASTDTLLLLDINNQNIIVAQCLMTDSTAVGESGVSEVIGTRHKLLNLDIINVMTIQEATKNRTFVNYMRSLSEFFSNADALNSFYIETLTEEKRKTLRNKPDAYNNVSELTKDDMLTSMLEMIHEDTEFMGDEKVNDVLVRAVINTDMVDKLNIGYKQVQKMCKDYGEESYTFDLIGGFGSKLEVFDYKFSNLHGSKDWKVYIYHANNGKKDIFVSTLSLHELINKIIKLKKPLVSKEEHKLVPIEDILRGYYVNKVDFEEFDESSLRVNGTYARVVLAVQRKTLETYLMLDLKGYRPIFRFKTLSDGMNFLNKYKNDRWSDLNRFLKDIHNSWYNNEYYIVETNSYYILRKMILKGLANNEPIPGELFKVSGYLAKQPCTKSW